MWLRVSLETLDRLTESLDFTDYASRIIHPIVRTLDTTPELRSTSMDTLSSLVFQLGKKVNVAVPWASFRCSYYSVGYLQPPHCWPQSLLLPARLLSLAIWWWGVVFMSMDEVIFSPPSPPLSLNHPIVFRCNLRATRLHACNAWQRMYRRSFWSESGGG